MPRPAEGKSEAHPPEKHNHAPHLNAALSEALKNWDPQQHAREVRIRIEASISPNPGGIGQYRVFLDPTGGS
jgi:hypothetical protein